MNDDGQKIMIGRIYRSYGAWPVGDALATEMLLLTELCDGINDIRFVYENDVRFLRQF
jgi:phenylalanyl-tRNA synthetase alpha subunit